MYKYLIFSVLLACALAQENPDRYFLSPPLPPTAFQGQYYTVQFRVIGIDNPQFSFSNLPPFLTAYSDGTIEGTPDRLGSFVAKIKFESPTASGSRDIVFRVANSNAVATAEEKVGRAGEKLFVVLNSGLTYSVGDKINITLSALNGKPQYTWNYINLPPQLSGNVFGYITGVFNIEGYYSFSASVSDSSGVTADSYLSINIQPKSVLKGSPLVQVPFRNIPMVYNIEQVQAQQQAATISVFTAIRTAQRRQGEVELARQDYSKAVLALQFATKQESSLEQNTGKCLQFQKESRDAASKARQALDNSTRALALVAISYQNALNIVEASQQGVSFSASKASQASQSLQQQSNAFIRAQTESASAVQAIKTAITTSLAARNIYALLFDWYSNRKKELQWALQKKQQADILVASAQNAVNLINQLNDNAQVDLALSQSNYQQASSALESAEGVSLALRQQLSNASVHLGIAKFNLQQTLNNLYVAQAAKEQADKATAIVSAQTSFLPTESLIASLFGGCDKKAYPTISGSAYVQSFNRLGFKLSSGSTLLLGSCTAGYGSIVQGDTIVYEGYIKGGFIHGLSVGAVQ